MSSWSVDLSIEEYMALDRLMGMLLTSEIVPVSDQQLINVMEELVLTEAIACVAEIKATSESSLDVGDIAAYALNRLPHLYATTEAGANYQRQSAKAELQELIAQQIGEAIAHHLAQPVTGKLLIGEVGAVPHKDLINVMEELVLTQAIASVAEIEATREISLDVVNIAAYTLNCLPPLYTTSEKDANYQRQRAELQELIAQQLGAAIRRNF